MILKNSLSFIQKCFYIGFIYRIILFVYAITIIFTYDSIINEWMAALLGACYLIYNIKIPYGHNKLTLFIDYLYITAILWGKDLSSFSMIVFFLLPIINTLHFPDYNRHYLYQIIFPLISFAFLLSYDKFNGVSIQDIFIPFAMLAVFLGFIVKSYRDRDKTTALLEDFIDRYYLTIGKPHYIYKDAIMLLNRKNEFIKNIVCFVTTDDYQNISLVNSSFMIYNSSLTLQAKDIKSLNKGTQLYNITLKCDGCEYNENILFPIKKDNIPYNEDDCQYLFVVILNEESSPLIHLLHIEELTYLFGRISKVLYVERKFKIKKQEQFELIRKKGRFVDASIKAIHFIKNRLGPIQTLSELCIDRKSYPTKKKEIRTLINKCAKRVQIDLKSITEQAEYIVNRENNPFHYQIKSSMSTEKLYVILRMVWNGAFPSKDIVIETNDLLQINTNGEALEILFSDIIGNMYKYQKDNSNCYFSCTDNELKIRFENDYEDEDKVQELIKAYNNDDKEEILKRKTYGVSNIKQIVNELNIELKSSITTDAKENRMFQIVLTFKVQKE